MIMSSIFRSIFVLLKPLFNALNSFTYVLFVVYFISYYINMWHF